MAGGIDRQLRACGRSGFPERIRVGGAVYQRRRLFKHDFFAGTLLYEREDMGGSDWGRDRAVRIVLKLHRQWDFLGVPLRWLGEATCRHELRVLQLLQGVEGVPRLIGPYGTIGLMYEYIEGQSLDEARQVPDDFFDRLEEVLGRVHGRGVVYVDANKRGNILVGDDGSAYMVDFQISLHIRERLLCSRKLARLVREMFQREDLYHLHKHKRRLRGDLMSDEEIVRSRRVSGWVGMHRKAAGPIRRMRRGVLRWLVGTGRISGDDVSGGGAESDPARWFK